MFRHRVRRLLAIGHSYCVGLNRRLPNEMARIADSHWSVTAVAPAFFHGDLSPIRTRAEAGERCALETVPAFLSRRIHFFFYGPKLARILHQGWDAIHCWEEPYIAAGAQIAWLAPRRVPIFFWTGQNIAKHYPPPFSQFERYCIDRCAGWMARGHTGIDALLARGYGRKPYRAVPLGVDTGLFRPDPDARRKTIRHLDWSEEGPPVVGFLGRFVEEKGLALLTAVLDQLSTPWRALFVGGGALEARLKEWGERHPGRVRIATGVAHDQVPAYLNAMDLLCAPSQTRSHWKEVFGRMLIEAFACGVPVIASDSGEIPYVIGDAGLIVGENDGGAWRDALNRALDHPWYRHQLGQRGMQRAHQLFSWPAVARQHLDFIEKAFSETDAQPG